MGRLTCSFEVASVGTQAVCGAGPVPVFNGQNSLQGKEEPRPPAGRGGLQGWPVGDETDSGTGLKARTSTQAVLTCALKCHR